MNPANGEQLLIIAKENAGQTHILRHNAEFKQEHSVFHQFNMRIMHYGDRGVMTIRHYAVRCVTTIRHYAHRGVMTIRH